MDAFADILGQETAIGALRTETTRGRMNHSYLFEGAVGTGRLSLTRALAASVLCAAGRDEASATTTLTVCGECQACRLFAAGNHPDYLELPRDMPLLSIHRFVQRAGSGSSSEKVEHPRVLDFLHLRPMLGRRRVCVVPDAERMRPEAANAFLKTLEEPPGDAMIILTTSARDRLLGTIVSRCRRLAVCPLPVDALAAELVRRAEISADAANDIARVAEGSLGLAMQLAGGEGLADWEWVRGSLVELTPKNAAAFATGLTERAKNSGKDGHAHRHAARQLLDLLALALRLRLRQGGPPGAIEQALGALWQAGEQIPANVRLDLVFQTAALEVFAALRRAA